MNGVRALPFLLSALLLGTGSIPVGATSAQSSGRLAPLRARPGIFAGRVTNEAGRPLARVLVVVGGVSDAGEKVSKETHTDANGLFAVKMPSGSYNIAYASYLAPTGMMDGNGPTYLPLALTDGPDGLNDSAEIGPGVVRNLVLKIHGPSASGGHFGADMRLIPVGGLAQEGYGVGSNLELTLTPQGVLADGTVGKTLTLRVPTKDRYYSDGKIMTNDTPRINDLPIGKYSLSARVVRKDGSAVPLRISLNTPNPEFAPALPIVFPQNMFAGNPRQNVNVSYQGTNVLVLKIDKG